MKSLAAELQSRPIENFLATVLRSTSYITNWPTWSLNAAR